MRALMALVICLVSFALTAQVKQVKSVAISKTSSNQAYIELAMQFESLAQQKPFTDFYFNAACYWSLVGEKKKAIYCLEQAVAEGFRFEEWIINEDDLSPLHREREWQILLKKVRTNKKKYEAKMKKEDRASNLLELEGEIKKEEKILVQSDGN